MASDPASVVIVGASLAGLRVASALRKMGFEGAVTLVGDEDHLPYDRPPLSKEVLEGSKTPGETQFRDPEFYEESAIDVRLGSRAAAIDTDARTIALDSGERLAYDSAVIATGARPRMLPGQADVPGVHAMRTLDDAAAITASFENATKVTVVGAGFIGSEVASSAHKRGLDVTIIEAADQPLVAAVGASIGARCAGLHEEYGVTLRCGIGVDAIASRDGQVAISLSDGTIEMCDSAVVGIGVIPNIEWLEGSGIELDGCVVCDEFMQTSAPGVFALGDLASWDNPLYERRMRVEHWTNTVEQAATVARNILNPDDLQPYAGVPYFWSDQYGHRLQLVGIATAEEPTYVHDPPGEPAILALYREGDRLAGAFAIDRVQWLMRMRTLLTQRAGFDEAVALAEDLASSQ